MDCTGNDQSDENNFSSTEIKHLQLLNFIKIILMRSITIIVACCVFFVGCKSQTAKPSVKKQANNNTLLWQVSGKGITTPSYLFGTFHLLCKDDIHLSAKL